jgi:multiple sugar transport system substrate-binding protein
MLSVVACSSGGTGPSAATSAPAGATQAPSGEKVALRMWTHQNPAFTAGYDALIAAYEDAHPNVDIALETFEYDTFIQTLQTAMPAGEEADIIVLFGSWGAGYAERLLAVPDDVMSLAEAKDLYYAAPLGGFVVNGTLYGFPEEFNCEYGGALVNKSLYEKAGLTYPPEWKTMEDVLADGEALVQKDDTGVMTVSGFHFASGDPAVFAFLAGILQRGGDYWNSDQSAFTFNTPQARDTLQWMVDAIQKRGVSDPILFEDAEGWVGDAFFEGRVGIGYIGTWAIADGKSNYPDFTDEWGYFFLPPVEGSDSLFAADSGWGLVVSKNCQNPDVAFDFCKFAAADPANATQFNIASGTIPAMPEVAESAEVAEAMPFVAKALSILPYGRYLGNMPDRDLIAYEIVYPHILKALQGGETVDQALQGMEAEANATFE